MQEQRIKVNEIKLIGNLAGPPDLKYFPSGAVKVSGRLAVTRKAKEEKVTDWFNFEAWGETGEALAELGKGARIGIQGQMVNDVWTNNEGQKRDSWKVKVWEWRAMEREAESRQAPASSRGTRPAAQQPEMLDDEIPF